MILNWLIFCILAVYEKMQILIEEINNLQELFPIPDTHLVFDLSLSHYPLLAQWPYHVLIDTLEMTAQCTILYQFYTF